MTRVRADLHESWEGHPYLDKFRQKLRNKTAEQFLRRDFAVQQIVKNEWQFGQDEAEFNYVGERSITTLEDALHFCKADLKQWEVDRYIFNSWDVSMKDSKGEAYKKTNYQVKVWFKRAEDWQWLAESIEAQLNEPTPLISAPGSKTGILVLTDLHNGAEVENLPRTPDFNMTVLKEKILRCVDKINSHRYEKVHLFLLGDLVESISGLNHLNSWKSMAKNAYGHRILINTFYLIRDYLISRIHNLKSVSLVSGNHDRISISNEVDNEGVACNLISFMLGLQYPA